MKDCLPWAGPHAGAEEKCEEEETKSLWTETDCCGLTTAPHSPSPLGQGGGRRVRNEGGKLSLGKQGQGKKVLF